jgi:hypothetical protein
MRETFFVGDEKSLEKFVVTEVHTVWTVRFCLIEFVGIRSASDKTGEEAAPMTQTAS